MIKIIFLFLSMIITGCVTNIPIPNPVPKSTNFCAPGQTKDCREYTVGDKEGAPVRGHSIETKEPL